MVDVIRGFPHPLGATFEDSDIRQVLKDKAVQDGGVRDVSMRFDPEELEILLRTG